MFRTKLSKHSYFICNTRPKLSKCTNIQQCTTHVCKYSSLFRLNCLKVHMWLKSFKLCKFLFTFKPYSGMVKDHALFKSKQDRFQMCDH